MAYSTTILLWGLLKYHDAYDNAGELGNMLDCVKWPLDYFIKAHTQPNELFVQVGRDGWIERERRFQMGCCKRTVVEIDP